MTLIERRKMIDRRCGQDRRNLTPEAAECLDVCRQANVIYVGIQYGFGLSEDTVLFQTSATGSCLAVPVENISVARIYNRINEQKLKQLKFFQENYGNLTNNGVVEAINELEKRVSQQRVGLPILPVLGMRDGEKADVQSSRGGNPTP